MLSSTSGESRPTLPRGRMVLIARRVRGRILNGELSVPMLSKSAAALMTLATSDDVDLKKLMRAIDSEPVIAARVLARANSSLYAQHGHTRSMLQAAMRLGTEYLRDLVIEIVAQACVFSDADTERAAQQQSDSVLCACLTRRAAELGTADPDFAFSGGLLHDIGRPIAWKLLGEELGEELDISSREVMCDILHAAVGAQVAQRWGLPESLVEVARHHHGVNIDGQEQDAIERLAHEFAMIDNESDPQSPELLATITAIDRLVTWMTAHPEANGVGESESTSDQRSGWDLAIDALALESEKREAFVTYARELQADAVKAA